jgi:hypothetical protein
MRATRRAASQAGRDLDFDIFLKLSIWDLKFFSQRRLPAFALGTPETLNLRTKRRPISPIFCLLGPHLSIQSFAQGLFFARESQPQKRTGFQLMLRLLNCAAP